MYIAEWQWDDGNTEHMAEHADVEHVLASQPEFRRNRRNRSASHQMIGPDEGGTFFAVFIVQLRGGLWRVVTARRATDPEIEWWRSY